MIVGLVEDLITNQKEPMVKVETPASAVEKSTYLRTSEVEEAIPTVSDIRETLQMKLNS